MKEHDDMTAATALSATAPGLTRQPSPLSVGVVGLGLIGGSLARRLAARGVRVSAWNHHDHPYAQAEADGIRCMATLAELAAARPDVLVLCNPLRAMPDMLAALAGPLDRRATTLTDVGSVKGVVRAQVEAAGLGACYVGAHPMTGNERSGWAAADAALYDGALWALTVGEDTAYRRFETVARMVVEDVGNRIIVIDDATHDRAAALISHMPHVVATALINELTGSGDRAIAAALAAGSWRDMTRVALTDPQRTRAMVDEDAANVEMLLRAMAGRLTAVADMLRDGDGAAIGAFFADGQPFRDYKASLTANMMNSADSAGSTGSAHAARASRLLRLEPDGWQAALLASARAGEHIVAMPGSRAVEVETRSAF